MARGAGPIGPWTWGAAGFVALLTLGPAVAVLIRTEGPVTLGPADWAAVRFTVGQAALSALFSVALAIPVARALARRRFPGRETIVTLLGAPFLLPVIVAVMGILAVFGRGGIVNDALGALGVAPVSIYGLHGVVLAHVFFNMPLAVRLILQGWAAIPGERFRLAASLGMGPGPIFRWLEWPMLRSVVPGALMIIFLICLASFAVALTLGGGPRATTVELAIYQAFRFEFDLGRAAALAAIQFALTAAAALAALRVTRMPGFGAGLDRVVPRWDAATAGLRTQDAAAIVLATVFLLLPLAMVMVGGVGGLAELPAGLFGAALRSAMVAVTATLLAIALALPLALAGARGRGGWVETAGYLPVAASPLVIGTGLFVLLFEFADPSRLALPVTALVNALMALPFAVRALAPPAAEIEASYGRLADSLGIRGGARLRWLILPRLRAPLGFAAGLAAALSMGDLGVIALFSTTGNETLPLEVYRLMAAYRTEAASGAALILLAMTLGAFWICDRGGRLNAPL